VTSYACGPVKCFLTRQADMTKGRDYPSPSSRGHFSSKETLSPLPSRHNNQLLPAPVAEFPLCGGTSPPFSPLRGKGNGEWISHQIQNSLTAPMFYNFLLPSFVHSLHEFLLHLCRPKPRQPELHGSCLSNSSAAGVSQNDRNSNEKGTNENNNEEKIKAQPSHSVEPHGHPRPPSWT
jgi:hypothetical protein